MSAERQKGTAFETSLLPLIRQWYPDADRRPLQGEKDKGDFLLPSESRFIIQAKNHRQMKLAEWVDAAGVQAFNFDPAGQAVGVVAHKRRGVTDPYQQYATLTLGDLLWLLNRSK